MHREILSAPDSAEVDHKDGNGLDNRKQNLRLASRVQNQCNKRRYSSNTCGFKGVHFHKQNRKWRARIEFNKKRISLGLFSSREEAGAAYIEAAKRLHGEFARW